MNGLEFRNFCEADYDAVCDFLIAINAPDRAHIHWNWARFEWMYEHPECDKSLLGSIGLWRDGDRIVGAAIYDMYFGEAFCGVLPEYASLYPEVLDYACRALKDENGLAIAINDQNSAEIEAAKAAGFASIEQTETLLRIALNRPLAASLPDGLRFGSFDPLEDANALGWLFWQGFDHGTDRAEFEREEQPVSEIRKHFNQDLNVIAVNETGEPVAIAGVWYLPETDYAYVEPVCTIPAYRGKGVGRAVVNEALNRARALGAKCAYVISDQTFYKRLGFALDSHFTFYRKG